MAKKKTSASAGAGTRKTGGKTANKDGVTNAARAAVEAIPGALKEAGQKAAELAQNPVARSLLAAGLVTAAAALAANKTVRDTTKKNAREARDATEAAFDAASESAGNIGAAMINAATDAVRKMMAGADEKPAAAKPAKPRATKPRTAKPAAKTSTAKPKAATKAAKPKAKTAAKNSTAKPKTAKA